MKICIIENCNQKHYGRGWCRKHYRILSGENKKRWQKVKNDPILHKKAKIANDRWYEEVKNTEEYKEFNRKRSYTFYHKSEKRRKYLDEWQKNLPEDKKKQYQKKENFYGHRRRAAKRNNGGSHTLQEWEDLKKFYDYRCLCCGQQEPAIILTEDHVLPLSKGGTDNIDNIQPLCTSCNCRKWKDHVDYRKE